MTMTSTGIVIAAALEEPRARRPNARARADDLIAVDEKSPNAGRERVAGGRDSGRHGSHRLSTQFWSYR